MGAFCFVRGKMNEPTQVQILGGDTVVAIAFTDLPRNIRDWLKTKYIGAGVHGEGAGMMDGAGRGLVKFAPENKQEVTYVGAQARGE